MPAPFAHHAFLTQKYVSNFGGFHPSKKLLVSGLPKQQFGRNGKRRGEMVKYSSFLPKRVRGIYFSKSPELWTALKCYPRNSDFSRGISSTSLLSQSLSLPIISLVVLAPKKSCFHRFLFPTRRFESHSHGFLARHPIQMTKPRHAVPWYGFHSFLS